MTSPLFESNGRPNTPTFTSRDILRILFKHKGALLLCFAVVTGSVAAGLAYLPPTYEAQAKVMVITEAQRMPVFFSGLATYRDPLVPDPPNRKLETEIALIETRSLCEDVVRDMNLTYDQVHHPAHVHFLNLARDTFAAHVAPRVGIPMTVESRGFEDAVEEFQSSISIQPVKTKTAEATSNVLEVRLKTPNADVAREALQRLLERYIQFDLRRNLDAGERAYDLLHRRTEEAYAELKHAEDRLQEFLAERGPSLSRTAPKTPGDESPVTRMKTRLVELELELIELRGTYRDEFVVIKKQEGIIEELTSRIRAEQVRQAESDVTIDALERECALAADLHRDLSRRLKETSIFLNVTEEQLRNPRMGSRILLEPPESPRTSDFKKKILIGLIGAFAGLLLGCAVAALREMNDHTLQTAAEVQHFLGLRTLAAVPYVGRGRLERVLDHGRLTHADRRPS